MAGARESAGHLVPTYARAISTRSAFSASMKISEKVGKGWMVSRRIFERNTSPDGQRRLLQPLARLRAERIGAGQPLTVAEQGQEAVGLGVGTRVGLHLRHHDIAAVPLNRASTAPTAAAWGSV